MKFILVIAILISFSIPNFSQSNTDVTAIEKTCLNYIEGFYEGDTAKVIAALKPSLYKFGYSKNKTSGEYQGDGHMTYEQAVKYAKTVYKKKYFARPNSPKRIEVLDVMNHIAAAKITAWWGVDYLLLSRGENNNWVIEQALWQGPLER